MGRRDHRGGDLRDRLAGRYSPRRRYSPLRDARSRHLIRGYSPSRSIEESTHSDRKRRSRQRLDSQSDISGDVRISEEPADHVNGGKSVLSESGHALLEQLRDVRADVEMIENRRAELEIYLEEQVQKADSLTSKIHELDDRLYQEKKECKRVNSKIKKFVRAHNRQSELQEELKRSHLQLANLEEQLGQEAVGVGANEDLSINIVSDEETRANIRNRAQNTKQDRASPNIKLLGLNQVGAEELQQQLKLNYHLGNAYMHDKDYEAMDRQRFTTGKSGDAKHKKDEGLSSGLAAGDKSNVSGVGFLPPTGMAAHAGDELTGLEENVVTLPSGNGFSEVRRFHLEDSQNVQYSDNVDVV